MPSRSAFNRDPTHLCAGVLFMASGAIEFADHDPVDAVADRISSLRTIETMPGETNRALHRDDTVHSMGIVGMEPVLGVVRSLSDFTRESGGTRVTPGSHRCMRAWHLPDIFRWALAGMQKGLSALLPGLDMARRGCAGWLRPEENPYLTTPPGIAVRHGPRLRSPMDQATHGFGDDRCGGHRDVCPAWTSTPPEPSRRAIRSRVRAMEGARVEGGG